MFRTPDWLTLWTSHQDYGWFLVALIWGMVGGAALRIAPRRHRALAFLAASIVLEALIEIGAHSFTTIPPHRTLDFVLGLLATMAMAALLWQGQVQRLDAPWKRALVCAAGLGFAALRYFSPIVGGALWSLAGVAAAWLQIRGSVNPGPAPAHDVLRPARWAGCMLALSFVISPAGGVAYANLLGRRDIDLSPFALPEITVLLIAGALWLASLWKQLALVPSSSAFRKELRPAWLGLSAWLLAGLGLVLWSGGRTREQHEENVRRRFESAASLIDRAVLTEAFNAQFRLGTMFTVYQPEGWPVTLAHAPAATGDSFEKLRRQLRAVFGVNPDAEYLTILSVRQGLLIGGPLSDDRPSTNHLVLVYGPATIDDLVQLEGKSAIVEPPKVGSWGAAVDVRVPLWDRGRRFAPAWLMIHYRMAVWRAAEAGDRLLVMSLVAFGVVLWGLVVAYRLRRAEREHALAEAGRATALARTKAAFLAKVSHELRTPLQSILGYGELLSESKLPPPHDGRVHAIRTQGFLLQRLVNDLLDLSAVESGRFRLQVRSESLAAVVADCVQACATQAEKKGLRLASEISGDCPVWIKTDSFRLRQALVNLLNNAVKFTPAGDVRMKVRLIENQGAESRELQFLVSDSGPGIPADEKQRIFEPFSRLEQHEGIVEGTGLGLSLVAALAAAMQGRVEVESDLGAGSCFIFTVPLHVGDPVATGNAAVRDLQAQRWRVLVVDDNTLVRDLFAAFLGEAGYVVQLAANGREALEKFRATPADVVVVDFSMPQLGGVEVARAIRGLSPPLRQPWIIGVSAHAGPVEAALAREAGMNRFLVKPIGRSDFLAAVADAGAFSSAGPGPNTTGLPMELRDQFIALFVQEWPSLRERLRSSWLDANWREFAAAAHYLKNSADMLGYRELGHASLRGEQAAIAEHAAGIEEAFLQIESAITQLSLFRPHIVVQQPKPKSSIP